MAYGRKTGGRQQGTLNYRNPSYARKLTARIAERKLDVEGLLIDAASGDEGVSPRQQRLLTQFMRQLEIACIADDEAANAAKADDPWLCLPPRGKKRYLEDPYEGALRDLEHAERQLRRYAGLAREAYGDTPPRQDQNQGPWFQWGATLLMVAYFQRNLECYADRGPELAGHIEERLDASRAWGSQYEMPGQPRQLIAESKLVSKVEKIVPEVTKQDQPLSQTAASKAAPAPASPAPASPAPASPAPASPAPAAPPPQPGAAHPRPASAPPARPAATQAFPPPQGAPLRGGPYKRGPGMDRPPGRSAAQPPAGDAMLAGEWDIRR
jgi:pyruvate/2-oxoglutarate dehydrogenase complex dihydrolipoamide acyltransferase (E2) component